MLNLYLLRHGQTDYNLKGIVQGRGVDSDLNDTGRAQAKAFYQAYQATKFQSLYASSLKRTQQTLQPFGRPYKIETGFDELDWGIFEGRNSDPELHQIYLTYIESWSKGDHNVKPEAGESPAEVSARQIPALKKLISTETGKVLICMHGRAMRILLCNLLGLSLSRMDEFEHQNTSLYTLKGRVLGEFELLRRNDLSHLL